MHLTFQQLSARVDEGLQGASLQLVERHLAMCESCRDELAALSVQDRVLAEVLTVETDAELAELIGLEVRCALYPRKAETLEKRIDALERSRAEARQRADVERRAAVEAAGDAENDEDLAVLADLTKLVRPAEPTPSETTPPALRPDERPAAPALTLVPTDPGEEGEPAEEDPELVEYVRAELTTRLRTELEPRIRAELEERIRVEIEPRIRSEIEADMRAETEALLRTEFEARHRAEARVQTREQARARERARRPASARGGFWRGVGRALQVIAAGAVLLLVLFNTWVAIENGALTRLIALGRSATATARHATLGGAAPLRSATSAPADSTR